MKRFSFSILLGLLLCIAPSVHAQVTIGMGTAPNAGALLDLKSQDPDANNTNATKGLGMPRVALTAVNKLQPMYSYADATPANTPDATALAAHTGLMVYNVDQCTLQGKGLYAWDGAQWQFLQSDASGVIRHPAKTGVYEAFTSASFGTAGRWMTTNLAAVAYDTGASHSQSRALQIMPNESAGYDKAYWAYPNVDGVGNQQLATTYNKNKALGYLYTWDAATAGKGGADGLGNIYNTAGSGSANNESGFPENTTGVQVANQQQRIQGICPVGWHLPSDWEWIQLEQEIIKSTTAYANVASIIDAGGTDASLASNLRVTYPTPGVDGNMSWLGSTHGAAMKSACLVPGITTPLPRGTSKTASQGGFAALLAGYAYGGSSINLGSWGFFWSSSSNYGDVDVWCRFVASGNSTVGRAVNARFVLYSVRCKKND